MSPKQLFKAFQNAHFCPFHDVRLVPAICGRHAESMAFCLLSIGPPFSPQNSTLVMSFLFQHLDLTRILGQKPSSHNFAKRARSSWSQMVSLRRSLSSWLRWRGPTPRRGRCGKPGKARQGWEPAGTIPERSKVLTYLDISWHVSFEIHMIHGSLAVSPSIRKPSKWSRRAKQRQILTEPLYATTFWYFLWYPLILSATEFPGSHHHQLTVLPKSSFLNVARLRLPRLNLSKV